MLLILHSCHEKDDDMLVVWQQFPGKRKRVMILLRDFPIFLLFHIFHRRRLEIKRIAHPGFLAKLTFLKNAPLTFCKWQLCSIPVSPPTFLRL